jgi:hypothetical protein
VLGNDSIMSLTTSASSVRCGVWAVVFANVNHSCASSMLGAVSRVAPVG